MHSSLTEDVDLSAAVPGFSGAHGQQRLYRVERERAGLRIDSIADNLTVARSDESSVFMMKHGIVLRPDQAIPERSPQTGRSGYLPACPEGDVTSSS